MYGVGGQEKVHGASFPAEIWADYMKQALAGQAKKDFPTPGDIGEKIYGDGASPSKTTPAPPSESASESPSESASESPSETPTSSPTETETCGPLDINCGDDEGGAGGPAAPEARRIRPPSRPPTTVLAISSAAPRATEESDRPAPVHPPVHRLSRGPAPPSHPTAGRAWRRARGAPVRTVRARGRRRRTRAHRRAPGAAVRPQGAWRPAGRPRRSCRRRNRVRQDGSMSVRENPSRHRPSGRPPRTR
ncbi:hypothetical protein NKH77_26615 [Streptomyces sp. M19]